MSQIPNKNRKPTILPLCATITARKPDDWGTNLTLKLKGTADKFGTTKLARS